MAFARRALLLAALFALIQPLSSAQGGIPELDITAWINEPGQLMICPAGDGESLSHQGLVITVQILDLAGIPIANYPFQDIYLYGYGVHPDEFNPCLGGSTADANTGPNGQTTFTGALFAGGWSDSGIQVYVAGAAVNTPPLDMNYNSPDIDADRDVLITDIVLFANDFAGVHQFRSDLANDPLNPGVINLSDISRMAAHIGHSCP